MPDDRSFPDFESYGQLAQALAKAVKLERFVVPSLSSPEAIRAVATQRVGGILKEIERGNLHPQKVAQLRSEIADLQQNSQIGDANMSMLERMDKALHETEVYRKGALDAVTATARGYLQFKQAAPQTEGTTKQSSRVGDPFLLNGKRLVAMQTAQIYLGVGKRRVQQLVKDGTLDTEGRGIHKKIVTDSLKKYVPPETAK